MKRICFSLFFLMLLSSARAQHTPALDSTAVAKSDTGSTAPVIMPPKPRPSPMAIAFHKEESMYLKVVYGQPSRKGREVFSEIAPYGKLWRTGANEATEITFTRDVKLGGKTLKAGTYTLFTIPNADKWTIILNSELGQWGEYKYDKAKDVLTFDVPAQKNNEAYEAFTIQFNETPTGADMALLWDSIKVVVPFAFAR